MLQPNISRVRGHFSKDLLASRSHRGDRVRQVQLSVPVIRLDAGQRRPEFLQGEAINRRIDLVEFALFFRKLRILDNRSNLRLGLPQNPPIARRVGEHRRQYRCCGVPRSMHGKQTLQGFRPNQWRIARHHQSNLGSAQRSAGNLDGVPSAVLRLLKHAFRGEGFNHRSDLLGLVPHHDHRLLRSQRSARPDDVFDQRATTRPM